MSDFPTAVTTEALERGGEIAPRFDANGLVAAIAQHADTGEVKRHRAFYMIDRTIPVGFEPGENHNVDRAILVRRYIE